MRARGLGQVVRRALRGVGGMRCDRNKAGEIGARQGLTTQCFDAA